MDETPTQPAEPTHTDLLLEEWFASWFHNIGLGTVLYNRFHEAKQDLKARLAKTVAP